MTGREGSMGQEEELPKCVMEQATELVGMAWLV